MLYAMAVGTMRFCFFTALPAYPASVCAGCPTATPVSGRFIAEACSA